VESRFPGQRSGLSLWSGSIESRTLDCQRTPNPIFMKTLTKASTCIPDLVSLNCQQHPVQDASQKQYTRQKKKPSIDRLPTDTQSISCHTALPIRGGRNSPLPSECRHASFQTQSLHKPLDQPYPPRAETERKNEYDPKAWEKETSNTVS